jgi:hypothetical protein
VPQIQCGTRRNKLDRLSWFNHQSNQNNKPKRQQNHQNQKPGTALGEQRSEHVVTDAHFFFLARLAFTPFCATLRRSSGESLANPFGTRTEPPSRPRATAAGFFAIENRCYHKRLPRCKHFYPGLQIAIDNHKRFQYNPGMQWIAGLLMALALLILLVGYRRKIQRRESARALARWVNR